MGGLKVAIVGAGRLGALVASRLAGQTRKVIITQHRAHAQAVADEVGGVASDQISAVRGCQVIFLAVPSQNIVSVLQEMMPHLDDDALVVNMATDLLTEELTIMFPRMRLVGAKVIGHAREVAGGSPAVVVLSHTDEDESDLVGGLLEGLGKVVRGSEDTVLAVNTAVAEEMVRAERLLRQRLEGLGLEDDLIRVAVRTTGPGILRSLGAGDPGPFLQEVIRRLRTADREVSPR